MRTMKVTRSHLEPQNSEPLEPPQSLFSVKSTRDLKKPEQITLSASALRQLANSLDRLMAFHANRGGQNPDTPKLYKVEVGNRDQITAYIKSGEQEFRLEYSGDSWVLTN